MTTFFNGVLIVRDLINCRPEDVDKILSKAVACTITKEEHALLQKQKGVDGREVTEDRG